MKVILRLILALIILTLLTSCDSEQIIVWRIQHIIGVVMLSVFILGFFSVYIVGCIKRMVKRIKIMKRKSDKENLKETVNNGKA